MKNILAILVALLQLLLSDVIIQIVLGSLLFWETSGAAGSDIILFVIEAYMGGLFLLTNLFILYESKIISTILILWLWGLLMLIVLSASILLAFIPGYVIGIFIEYRVKRKILDYIAVIQCNLIPLSSKLSRNNTK